MRKLVLYEWIVSLVYEMLLECTAQCTGEGLSDEFEGSSVYTRALGSVHSIVLDALSQ